VNCQSHLYRGQPGKLITRRWFFEQCGVGLGAIALGQLFRDNGWAAPATPTNPLAPKQPPFPGKAKRVIFLFMAGAPSHLELFDYKPELAKWNGKLPPAELVKGYRAAFINQSHMAQVQGSGGMPVRRGTWDSSRTAPKSPAAAASSVMHAGPSTMRPVKSS
jgi:hypothetical protein